MRCSRNIGDRVCDCRIFVPVDPRVPGADNPPSMGPAGTVHASIADWIKFGQVFIGGGPQGFLSRTTTAELLRPAGNSYAAGWFVVDRAWAGGTALNHHGSSTLNFATVWLAPNKGRGIVIAANGTNSDTPAVLDRLAGWMVTRYIATFESTD